MSFIWSDLSLWQRILWFLVWLDCSFDIMIWCWSLEMMENCLLLMLCTCEKCCWWLWDWREAVSSWTDLVYAPYSRDTICRLDSSCALTTREAVLKATAGAMFLQHKNSRCLVAVIEERKQKGKLSQISLVVNPLCSPPPHTHTPHVCQQNRGQLSMGVGLSQGGLVILKWGSIGVGKQGWGYLTDLAFTEQNISTRCPAPKGHCTITI